MATTWILHYAHCKYVCLADSIWIRIGHIFVLAVTILGVCPPIKATAEVAFRHPPVWFAQQDALQRGLQALKENHPEQALEALTTAEQESPGDARIRNSRGIALLQLGKAAEAEAEYKEAIRLDPQFADAWRNLGFLRWTMHQLDAAREALANAITLAPDDTFAHYYLGRVNLDAQRYEDAFRELKRSGLPVPDNPAFLIQLAEGHLALGEKDEAKRLLRQIPVQALEPLQTVRIASMLVELGEFGGAISILESASNTNPSGHQKWLHFDLALCYVFAGKYQQAEQLSKALAKAEQNNDSNPAQSAAAWSLLGIANARLGQGDSAVEAFRKATNLEPEKEEHWLNLTRELMELTRFPEAISATREGISANPKSYALRLRLGAANLAGGKYPEAETAFRTLVDAGDPLPTSYIGLAQVLLREGRPNDAADVLLAARQKIGDNFLLDYFLGLSLDRAGKRTQAITAFQDAVRLNPKSAEAHLGLGKSELAAGQVEVAISELQESLRLSPGNVQARRLLSQAYRRAGDVKRAEEFATSSSEETSPAEGDLVQDFFLPNWQLPEGQHPR